MLNYKEKKNIVFSETNILNLVKQYGSPIWIYDSNIIVNRIRQLRQFDIIRFAQKSCSNIHILKLFRKHRVKIDAVSLGEIERGLISGYNCTNQDIIFTADVIDRYTLEKIVKYHIPVNVGSTDMLKQIGTVSPGHSIWLRINPKFGHGHSTKTNTGGENSKHGIWDVSLAIPLIKRYNLKLIGLHMHIGSGVDHKYLYNVCREMVQQVLYLNHDIEVISAGGGLTVPYKERDEVFDVNKYFMLWNIARKKIADYLKHPIRLEIEPGRFLVAESGILVSEVRSVKRTSSKLFVLIDAGFNDLMRPVMYGSYHHISVLPGDGREIDKNDIIETIVGGPLCESGDVFTQNGKGDLKVRMLPKVRFGDYLVFHNTGAYGASMSSNYNSRLLIPEVLFQNGTFRLIRKRQTINQLLELEKSCK
ncbi:diaminopimelate decarboxylase [Buchnera aphidicola (Schlechtendalia chinensis)]|uniref:Diaminopimelate decarboxylase n=1 Tax=Buchnera aphidicola subsp. Schlechtendalia chinensis TaxID=118110 RepID=A0A172WDV6_BUCSC|nr:diaminopimelate decarboxylase [Buchnera aphidicola]ANF17154.1 diaminopimelate decarboxylase [Buchnera aphidicola (Schlechtendalia chinensis)]